MSESLTLAEIDFISKYKHFLEGYCAFEEMGIRADLVEKGYIEESRNGCIKSLKVKWTNEALEYINNL